MKTENNILIANFLKYDFNETFGMFFIPHLNEQYNCDAMLFDSDWNWLMLAVHESITISSDESFNEWNGNIADSLMSADISIVYNEVVSFINFYNEYETKLLTENQYTEYTVEEVNKNYGFDILDGDDCEDVSNKIEATGWQTFYISFSQDDVNEAIEYDKESADSLDLHCICIMPMGIYTAIY